MFNNPRCQASKPFLQQSHVSRMPIHQGLLACSVHYKMV